MLTNDSPPDEVARAIILECVRRGYPRDKTIAVVSTLRQESGLRMVWDPSRRWYGYAQQDASYSNRMDPTGNFMAFLDHLDEQERKPGASTDHFENIFWLQQGPNWPSAAHGLKVGRREYLDEIRSEIDAAVSDYNRVAGIGTPSTGGSMAPKGDPVWLEEALRKRLGDRLVVHEGWRERGAGGTMAPNGLWGVMIHHTGNDNERVEIIRDGVQQPTGWLPGPLAQGLITRDGKFHLIAVGPCNHAGGGQYNDLTQGNRDSIGIECAYDGDPARWPDVMILTMRDATRAILEHAQLGSDRVCGHKEYALPRGRKPDPANLDMDWFRGEVGKALKGQFDVVPPPVSPQPPPSDPLAPPATAGRIEYLASCAYWEMLGWRTQTEVLALLLDKALGTENAGKQGVSLTRPKE